MTQNVVICNNQFKGRNRKNDDLGTDPDGCDGEGDR